MDGIAQEISPAQVVNVNAVSIEPPHWPKANHVEPITAVLKTSRPAGEFGTVYVKRVATAKTGLETSFRNVPMAACRGPCPAGLLLAPSLLRLLCRLRLLLALSLSRLLGWLGLLLALSLLRLSCWLGLWLVLTALLLLRRLSLLLVLSMLLLLCRLSLLLVLLWLLLLPVFLPEGGNNGSGKQEHDCCS